MNRRDFQRLAETRLGDAEALLNACRYSAAYYLAGYAVECALKACIAKQTRRHDFPPDPRAISGIFTHQLDTLVQAADLRVELDIETLRDPQFNDYWALMTDWSEQARYEVRARSEVVEFVTAISDAVHGVLQWSASMVKTSLVERDLEIGARLVRLLDEAGIDVRAALWLYSEETKRWKLVIHTPLYESNGPLEAIDAVLTVMEKNQIPREILSSTDMSITGRRHDVIRALHTKYHTGPRDIDNIRLAGDIVDRILIDEAYVYRVA